VTGGTEFATADVASGEVVSTLPASIRVIVVGRKGTAMSNSPAESSRPTEAGNRGVPRYCTSVKPSALRSSSAISCGATQVEGIWTSLSVVVSGGGSAATSLGCKPRSPAVPASVNPSRNSRRLNRLACWILMGTSLPDPGQRDTKNAG